MEKEQSFQIMALPHVKNHIHKQNKIKNNLSTTSNHMQHLK